MRKQSNAILFIFILTIIICSAFFGYTAQNKLHINADGSSDYTVVYVKDGGSGSYDGSSASNAVSTITEAISILDNNNGIIVLCGPVSIGEYTEPAHTGNIIITSYYNGVDYKKTSGALFMLNNKYILGGPVRFENITVSTNGSTRLFFGNGYPLEFGKGVECTLTTASGTYPYVFGGNNKKSGTLSGASVTISSGHFSKVTGGNRYVGGSIEGDISVTINGGTVDNYLNGSGVGTVKGNVAVTIGGGKIGYGVYGIDSLPDRATTVTGNVTLNINGGDLAGTIAAARHDAYATLNGAYTCYVNTPELDSVAELRGTEYVGGNNTSKIVFAENVNTEKTESTTVTYQNPVITGADPWVIYHDGYYYMAVTRGSSITIAKAQTVAELGRADPICVWTATTDTGVDDSIWSPELHYFSAEDFGAKYAGWYLYFACPPADHPGDNYYRRCYSLRALTDDPQGAWGSPTDKTPDKPMQIKMDADNSNWNIGPSVFRINGKIYMTWTGRIFEYYGIHKQNLNIAKMTNPYTLDLSTHAIICEPTKSWEKQGATYSSSREKNLPEVVEGATAVYGDNGEIWCIYSASGYWNENYALAQLRFKGGDPCNINNWEKSSSPIFVHNNEVYGPGHASYTTGHDGKRYFIYHGYLLPKNEGSRYIFIEEYSINGNNVKLGGGTPAPLSSVKTVAKTTKTLSARTAGFNNVITNYQSGTGPSTSTAPGTSAVPSTSSNQSTSAVPSTSASQSTSAVPSTSASQSNNNGNLDNDTDIDVDTDNTVDTSSQGTAEEVSDKASDVTHTQSDDTVNTETPSADATADTDSTNDTPEEESTTLSEQQATSSSQTNSTLSAIIIAACAAIAIAVGVPVTLFILKKKNATQNQ